MIDIAITDIIMRFVRANRKPRVVGIYYPSELFWCLRKLYYDYTIGKDRDLDAMLKMMAGNLMHSFISNILKWAVSVGVIKSADSEVEYEYEFNGIKISGKADDIVILSFSDFDEKCVIEVKSVSEFPDKPRIEHIAQLNFYLYFNKDAVGYLLYIKRDDFTMKAYDYKFSEDLFKSLVSRAEKLHSHLISNSLPEREVYHGECWRCIYRNICFSSQKSI